MDQQQMLLYCVVTATLHYPEQPAYRLLNELMGIVQRLPDLDTASEGSLNQQLHPEMQQLLNQYETAGDVEDNDVESGVRGGMGATSSQMVQPKMVSSAREVTIPQQGNRQMMIYAGLASVVVLLLLIVIIAYANRSSGDK